MVRNERTSFHVATDMYACVECNEVRSTLGLFLQVLGRDNLRMNDIGALRE
jgi:hypothetical protein